MGVAKYSGSTPLSMVAAFDIEQGLVLYHEAEQGKSDELPMTGGLIGSLEITGTISMLDALLTLSSFSGRRGQSVTSRSKRGLR